MRCGILWVWCDGWLGAGERTAVEGLFIVNRGQAVLEEVGGATVQLFLSGHFFR